eukprot:394804_1
MLQYHINLKIKLNHGKSIIIIKAYEWHMSGIWNITQHITKHMSYKTAYGWNKQLQLQLQFEKELYYIQKLICKMFKTKCDKGVIFIETVRNLKKNYHSIIHCYPIEIEKYNLCPIYFKKSIIESDVLWNTNKKLIEITKDKPLNKSITHYMSYFSVQFGVFDGYTHIIEDENKIKQDFGAQIIAGIIEKVLFKIKNECYQKQIQQVDEFIIFSDMVVACEQCLAI